MFEKDAEEYTKNIFCNINCSIGHPRARSVNLLDVEQAFQDGAEFGYNKANDQLTKAKELLKDITSSYGSTEVSEAQLYLKIKKAEIFLKDSEVEK